MRSSVLRLTALAILSSALGGCVTWQGRSAQAVVPRADAPQPARGRVRVTLRDGRVLTLRDAALAGDSLVGRPDGGAPAGARVAVAVADVRALAVRRVSVGRTVGLLAGIAAAAGAVWAALVYITLSTAYT